MIRNKAHAEEPLTEAELEVIRASGLIDADDPSYAAIRFANYLLGMPRLVFRFPNGYSLSVIKENERVYTVIPSNSSGFIDYTTKMGCYKTCWHRDDVLAYLKKISAW